MSVRERVLKVIAQESHKIFHEGQLETSFDELGVDSLDKVCILYGLEQEFGVSISEEAASRFTNVRQVLEHLTEVRGAAAKPASSR